MGIDNIFRQGPIGWLDPDIDSQKDNFDGKILGELQVLSFHEFYVKVIKFRNQHQQVTWNIMNSLDNHTCISSDVGHRLNYSG